MRLTITDRLWRASAVLLLLCAAFAPAAPAQDVHAKILAAIESRDYQTALGELEALRAADRKIFELNNYDYLLGRVAERKGDLATAAAAYQTVAARGSLLREYALWRLASIARAGGNLLLERSFLQELLAYAPDALAADAARTRIARSLFESGSYEAAIAALGALLAAAPAAEPAAAAPGARASGPPTPPEKTARYRENLVILAAAYERSGRAAEARDAYARLIASAPNPSQPDDFALAGAKGLDRMEAAAAAPLTDLQRLQRATVYQFNRDFAAARGHYQAIVKNFPQSGLVPDALFQIGRGYVQEGDFVEAITWFERVQEQYPEHPAARDALAQAASAYARVSKPKESLTRYQKFIEKYPDAENLDRAYLNVIDVERDIGEDSDALKWAAKTQEAFRGKLPEALALFAQLRIRVARGEWQNAYADAERLAGFADLGGTRVPGGTNRAEVTFIKGFALENLQRYDEAIDVYLSIPDGRAEYYGWRATERLKLLAASERAGSFVRRRVEALAANLEARPPAEQKKAAQDILRMNLLLETQQKMLDVLRRAYAALPEYQRVPSFRLLEFGRRETLREKRAPPADRRRARADELLFLGLYDEGTPELEAALPAAEKTKTGDAARAEDVAYTLAVYYRRGDLAHRATAFAEPLWRAVPADYQIELIPREQAELLYPAPYAAALVRYAPARGVDPRFLLSIMRQESRFRADVKSNAAARGLMQFISMTANRIARELGREDFRQDDLYDPPTAVLFGAQYLGNLFRQFPNNEAAVAASYNGGEDNVRRWLNRAKSDLVDRYLPEIVFSQSKDYACKVMANYRVYRVFYDENLSPR